MTNVGRAACRLAVAGVLSLCASAGAATGPVAAWTGCGNGTPRWSNTATDPVAVTAIRAAARGQENDGRSWHETAALGDAFAVFGSDIYWWKDGSLHVITDFPPKSAREPVRSQLALALPDGTFVGTASMPDGIAVLVSDRVSGHGWDGAPPVLIVHGAEVETARLPAQRGQILAEQIDADDGST
jgi:hypothetical protein